MAAPTSAPTAPGHGLIHARLLPPARLVLPHLNFTYPLKLICTSPPTARCLTVFILSYGGGLVSNDHIHLTVVCEAHSKLCLLTQGSTKLFKRRSPSHVTSQHLTATLHSSAALLLLPDVLQPFADSHYTQTQTLHLPADDTASFVLLDWLSEGRSARGEHWALHRLSSRNEVRCAGRLVLRDAMVLDEQSVGGEGLRARMDGVACLGTLVVRGPLFAGLVAYVRGRFEREPRIGGRGFGEDAGAVVGRRKWEVLWTAASVRGCLLVKVSGRELQEVRGFLKELLEEGKREDESEGEGEGDVVREFGADALWCLR